MNELFSSVVGYEGLYEIGTFGTVKSIDRVVHYSDGRTRKHVGQIISSVDNGHGYKFVYLWRENKSKRFYVHRLVAEAFIPNPDKKQFVNHKDEDKSNNSVSNLEWCTSSENVNYGTAISRSRKKQGFEAFLVSDTGDIKRFDSISSLAKFVGSSKGLAIYYYHKSMRESGVGKIYEHLLRH